MSLPFVPTHVHSSGDFRLPASLEQVFPLFTPLGEKHWAQGWDPHIYYPVSGLPEIGSVFLTMHADEPATIWVMTQYAPEIGQISYARTTPQIVAGMVTVQCAAEAPSTTYVRVAYRMTALSEAGNAFLSFFAQSHGPRWISSWESAIRHYLSYGHAPSH